MTLRRLKWGLAAGALLAIIVGSAVGAPWLSPYDPLAVDIQHRLGPPAWMDGGARTCWAPIKSDAISSRAWSTAAACRW